MTNTPQIDSPSNFDVEALLAFHAQNFGSARMEDAPVVEPVVKADAPVVEPVVKADEPVVKADDKPTGDEELSPEVLRKELTKVRGEAANYRTKYREATEALSKAKTPEEITAATAEFTDKIATLEHSILRSAIATKHDLPADLADALKGATEAELEAHAKMLAKYTGTVAPTDLNGGLDPSDKDDGEMDPGKLARKHSTRR